MALRRGRYKEARMSAAVEAAIARADAVVEAASAEVIDPGAKPFTRCTPPSLTPLPFMCPPPPGPSFLAAAKLAPSELREASINLACAGSRSNPNLRFRS